MNWRLIIMCVLACAGCTSKSIGPSDVTSRAGGSGVNRERAAQLDVECREAYGPNWKTWPMEAREAFAEAAGADLGMHLQLEKTGEVYR